MGSWSEHCGISNIQICYGQDIILLPLKKTQYSETREYCPATLPIFGKYNDYGGIDEIIEDDNTRLISDYFGVSIDDFCEILTRGVDLHKINDDKIHEFNEMSYMFIDRKVYEHMKDIKHTGFQAMGSLDMGRDSILTYLGFEYIGTIEDKRYNKHYKFNNLNFYSDGTYLNDTNGRGIYNFNTLDKIVNFANDKKHIGKLNRWTAWRFITNVNKQKQHLSSIFDVSSYKFLLASILPNSSPFVADYISDNYINEIETYGDRIAELGCIRHNMYSISKTYLPLVKYLTPQCREHNIAQDLFDKFSEINRSYIGDVYDDYE